MQTQSWGDWGDTHTQSWDTGAGLGVEKNLWDTNQSLGLWFRECFWHPEGEKNPKFMGGRGATGRLSSKFPLQSGFCPLHISCLWSPPASGSFLEAPNPPRFEFSQTKEFCGCLRTTESRINKSQSCGVPVKQNKTWRSFYRIKTAGKIIAQCVLWSLALIRQNQARVIEKSKKINIKPKFLDVLESLQPVLVFLEAHRAQQNSQKQAEERERLRSNEGRFRKCRIQLLGSRAELTTSC